MAGEGAGGANHEETAAVKETTATPCQNPPSTTAATPSYSAVAVSHPAPPQRVGDQAAFVALATTNKRTILLLLQHEE